MNNRVPNLPLYRASLKRVGAAPGFFRHFCNLFIGGSPEIAAFFSHENRNQIQRRLKTTVRMLAAYAENQLGTNIFLESAAGRTHRKLLIHPKHFTFWRDTLVATAAEYDPEFDDATRREWEWIIDSMLDTARTEPND